MARALCCLLCEPSANFTCTHCLTIFTCFCIVIPSLLIVFALVAKNFSLSSSGLCPNWKIGIETNGAVPYFSTFFDPTITDFYGWTIPKGDMILVGAALSPRKDVIKKFKQLKQGLIRRGLLLGKTIAREGAVINRPVSINQIYTGAGGVALLGEAAGWISPSSAEGFSYAFKSARYLGEALNDGLVGFNKRYARYTRKMRINIVLKNLKSPLMYNNLFRKVILHSGIRSVKLVGPKE